MWWGVAIFIVILLILATMGKMRKPMLGLIISVGKVDDSIEGILRYAQGLVKRGYLAGVWVDDTHASRETKEIVIRLVRNMSGIEIFEGNPPYEQVDFIYLGHVDDESADRFMSSLRWIIDHQEMRTTYFSD